LSWLRIEVKSPQNKTVLMDAQQGQRVSFQQIIWH